MSRRVVAAIDIGASGGRVIAGLLGDDRLDVDIVHRFENGVALSNGHLRWNTSRLFGEVLVGLTRVAEKYPQVESIGVDSWAVDYALLDDEGRLLDEPVAYRDPRTTEAVHHVHSVIEPSELFALNGLQFLPFSTIYQLCAEQRSSCWPRVRHVVLIPDLIAYWLSGTLRAEYTNASTTGLLDVRTREWSPRLLDVLGIDPSVFAALDQPGDRRGTITADVAARTGLRSSTVVTTVGSHDTASAVVGVPATEPGFAYVASGTWSLVGVETPAPVLSHAARAANFTNEGGVDGRIRLLRNVGGLWLLQECIRTWRAEGAPANLGSLLAAARGVDAGGPTFDVDDPELVAPDDMPARIACLLGRGAVRVPATRPALVRCILDSLASAYGRTIQSAAALSGLAVERVHVVGGGAQNELLCELTANATQLPVLAGPVEATAIGNIMVQARSIGAAPPTLEQIRSVVAESCKVRRYEPSTTR